MCIVIVFRKNYFLKMPFSFEAMPSFFVFGFASTSTNSASSISFFFAFPVGVVDWAPLLLLLLPPNKAPMNPNPPDAPAPPIDDFTASSSRTPVAFSFFMTSVNNPVISLSVAILSKSFMDGCFVGFLMSIIPRSLSFIDSCVHKAVSCGSDWIVAKILCAAAAVLGLNPGGGGGAELANRECWSAVAEIRAYVRGRCCCCWVWRERRTLDVVTDLKNISGMCVCGFFVLLVNRFTVFLL
ncbi:hypothetical protein BJ741DRAFT_597047 [Chytriomyces cf. hyalinus JEL632]|nr:hypothetical protein BJ741DRAFT_597047 [Chytriomyces cf. hyalinus JEL632]